MARGNPGEDHPAENAPGEHLEPPTEHHREGSDPGAHHRKTRRMKGRAHDNAQKSHEEGADETRPVPRPLGRHRLAQGIHEPVREAPDRIDDRIVKRHGAGVGPRPKDEETPENGCGGKKEKLQQRS